MIHKFTVNILKSLIFLLFISWNLASAQNESPILVLNTGE